MLLELSGKTAPGADNCLKNIHLEETLRPLWKLTCRGGILLDWITPCSSGNRVLSFIRYISIGIVLIFLISVTIFELVQLIIAITFMESIHVIVPHLIWFTTLPLTVMTMVCYLLNRKEYMTFFQDWSELETEMITTIRICKSKNTHNMMYFAYILNTIVALVSLTIDICYHPDANYLLSSYPILVKTFKFPVLATIHITAIVFKWILFTMIDFVPAFVYYHQSLAICRLNGDCIALFSHLTTFRKISTEGKTARSCILGLEKTTGEEESFGDSVRHLWMRFENVAAMVGRANRLFGKLIAAGHGVSLFMICVLLYSTLFQWTNKSVSNSKIIHQVKMWSFVTNLSAFVFRLISCTLLSAKVHEKSLLIRNTLTLNLSKYWDIIPISDRDVLVVLNGRLQQRDTLAASPLDLYTISSSILLTILGLVASYVVILLQSSK